MRSGRGVNRIAVWLVFVLLSLCCAAQAAMREGPFQPKIIGGEEATPGSWPWMAALVFRDIPDVHQGQFCGGSLIHPEWILTAAHCVYRMPFPIDAVVGTNDLGSLPGEYDRIQVVEIIEHPGYNPFTNDNDIALLRLSRPSEQTLMPSLTNPANQSAIAPPGVDATVVGWGDTDISPWYEDYPENLMQVDLPIISNAKCKRTYGRVITDNMLCAGFDEGGKDSCQGDSGGPLMVEDGQGGYAQTGVVSWGVGCAFAGYYGVYTRISRYNDWISDYVDLNDRCGDCNGDGAVDQLDFSERRNSIYQVFQTWIQDCWTVGSECGDYDGDEDIDARDLLAKYQDLIKEFRDWQRICWLPEVSDS